MKDVLPVSVGAAAIANTTWWDLLTSVWQLGLSGAGGVVLVLTARSKWLEIKQRKRDLFAK